MPYFHNLANMRRQRTRIKQLKNNQGNWVDGTDYLNPVVSDYFAGLFTTEVDVTDSELLAKVVPRVTSEMNEAL